METDEPAVSDPRQDLEQAPISPAHASLGADGRITTVYPNGQAYTDPTPRLDLTLASADAMERHQDLANRLERIESKLDQLLAALGEDKPEAEQRPNGRAHAP